MRKSLLFTLPIVLASTMPTALGSTAVTTAYEFADTNPLATGNWVRISIGESGIYEITYDELRRMGFSDPSKVAVYGQPGAERELNMLDAYGRRLVEDIIAPVRVLHTDNKLLFYGEGPERINFDTTGTTDSPKGIHKRSSKNMYTYTPSYMLTDSHPAETVPSMTVSDKSSVKEFGNGYAFHYHEKDMTQGIDNAGRHIWGEPVAINSKVSFPVTVKYAVANSPCVINSDIVVYRGMKGNFNISINDNARTYTLSRTTNSIFTWNNTLGTNRLNVSSDHIGTGTVSFQATGENPENKTLAIDYWTLTYPISLAYARGDASFTQQYIGFVNQANVWRHTLPEGSIAWDITDHAAPTALDSDGMYFYKDNGPIAVRTEVVVFNPRKTQKKIEPGFERVANQDLHALQETGIDMIIFAVPDMLPYAKRIAELHARYDGQKVEVVDPQTVYNEFTSGTPDPAAFRMFAKMLYHNDSHRLKNVLLMGPVYADFLNIVKMPDRPYGMIAYQQKVDDLSNMAAPLMDYYGIMTDRVPMPDNLETAPISVGVGLLPIDTPEEAELVVNKIKNYLAKEDFSTIVNETLSISCEGDGHLHDNQAIRMGKLLQEQANKNFNSEFSHHTVWIEQTGANRATREITDALHRGKAFSIYYGHAASVGFGGMSTENFLNLDNEDQGIFFFAGCDLANTDHGRHGIGDIGVLRNSKGLAAAVFATRSVLSNFNDALARNFANSFFVKGASNQAVLRTETPTLGEVFARSKDITANDSEFAYVLIGDPALKVPVALGSIDLEVDADEVRGGDLVEVKGRVVDANGSTITDYNGHATVKLMEPKRIIPWEISVNVKDNGVRDTSIVREQIDYNDQRIMAVKTRVENGRFSVKLPIPAKCDQFRPNDGENESLLLLASAYNPENYLGTSGRAELPLATFGTTSSDDAEKDEVAPALSLEYDDRLMVLRATATDNSALMPGIGAGGAVTLTIDGNPYIANGGESTGIAVTRYEGAVSAARLGAGRHTAIATACDVAGNSSDPVTLQFTIADKSPVVLTADKTVAIDNISFRIGGSNTNSGDMSLLVADHDGNVVANLDFGGTSLDCDTSDFPSGVYRAAVRRQSAAGSLSYSNWVEFTVID